MKKRSFVIITLLIGIVIFFGFYFGNWTTSLPSNNLSLEEEKKDSKLGMQDLSMNSTSYKQMPVRKRVIDCSGYPPPIECSERVIENTVTNCTHWFQGFHELSEIQCANTTKDLDLVDYISTPINHIRAKMALVNYTVRIMPQRHSFMMINKSKNFHGAFFSAWDLEVAQDGLVFVTQKFGRINYFRIGEFIGYTDINVISEENSGLMGLAIDPNFIENKFIYVMYSYQKDTKIQENGIRSRISRFTFDGKKITNEKILLDNIPGNAHHAGGRIEIGPDLKLYATTGDSDMWISTHNQENLIGKVLRMNLDGSIPEDNPFENSYVYSLGHRNSQGLAWNPETGSLFSTEHGNQRSDEINLITKGKNYGWGVRSCDSWEFLECIHDFEEECRSMSQDKEFYEDPVWCSKEWTLAPSGAVFVDEVSHPWYGSLFVASLQGQHLHRFLFAEDNIVDNEVFYYVDPIFVDKGDYYEAMGRRIRDVEYFNGSLWVLSAESGIAILRPLK